MQIRYVHISFVFSFKSTLNYWAFLIALWWGKMKCHGFTQVFTIDPKLDMNVPTKCNGDPSNVDILLIKKSDCHQSEKNVSFGDYECLEKFKVADKSGGWTNHRLCHP